MNSESEAVNALNVGVVLLAAGASRRLGRPKQLLQYKGRMLLENAMSAAIASYASPVILVLGAHAGLIQEQIDCSAVHRVVNEEWQEGMASSIRCGIAELQKIAPSASGVLLMTCDQPHVNDDLLNRLMNCQPESGKPIIACSYGGIQGVPAYFDRSLFSQLLELRGDVGARRIIQSNPQLIELISFEEGCWDIDREEDL